MDGKLDAKDAVQKAKEYAQEIYQQADKESSLENVSVDEVDFNSEQNIWLITLSWNDQAFRDILSAEMSGAKSKAPQTNKVFYINGKDGTLQKIKAVKS